MIKVETSQINLLGCDISKRTIVAEIKIYLKNQFTSIVNSRRDFESLYFVDVIFSSSKFDVEIFCYKNTIMQIILFPESQNIKADDYIAVAEHNRKWLFDVLGKPLLDMKQEVFYFYEEMEVSSFCDIKNKQSYIAISFTGIESDPFQLL